MNTANELHLSSLISQTSVLGVYLHCTLKLEVLQHTLIQLECMMQLAFRHRPIQKQRIRMSCHVLFMGAHHQPKQCLNITCTALQIVYVPVLCGH
jgi:hypothetical protein